MKVKVNKKVEWISYPTINTMIAALKTLEKHGVDPNANIKISQMLNSPETFVISELNSSTPFYAEIEI